MKTASLLHKSGPSGGEKRPSNWSLSERLTALQESHALSGVAAGARQASACRIAGLSACTLHGIEDVKQRSPSQA